MGIWGLGLRATGAGAGGYMGAGPQGYWGPKKTNHENEFSQLYNDVLLYDFTKNMNHKHAFHYVIRSFSTKNE